MTVYLDLALVLNFLVDGLLLLGTNRLAGHPPGWKRCALAAALGGAYGCACLIPGLTFLGSTLWRLVFLGLMGAVAFGMGKSAWKKCLLFVLLSMALGGLAVGMGGGSFWMLVLSAGVLWLLCRVGFGGQTVGARQYVPLELRHQGKQLRLTALIDTGNGLRDPITGEAVLVVGPDEARILTGLSPQQLRSPVTTVSQGVVPGLRLVPYRAVGQHSGMLLAMRIRECNLGGRKGPVLVAFAPEKIGNDGYHALAGGCL